MALVSDLTMSVGDKYQENKPTLIGNLVLSTGARLFKNKEN